jgi:hypothetical protein
MIRIFFESKKPIWEQPQLMVLNDAQKTKLREYAKQNLGKILVVEIRELEEVLTPIEAIK